MALPFCREVFALSSFALEPDKALPCGSHPLSLFNFLMYNRRGWDFLAYSLITGLRFPSSMALPFCREVFALSSFALEPDKALPCGSHPLSLFNFLMYNRRGWDSNPRYIAVHRLSRSAP